MGSESSLDRQPVSHCAIGWADAFQDGVGGNSPVNYGRFATTPYDRLGTTEMTHAASAERLRVWVIT